MFGIHVNGDLREAPIETRQRGFINGKAVLAICDAGKRNFTEAMRNCRVAEALHEQIECDSFVTWRPGRGPKELEQMAYQEQVIELRKDMIALTNSFQDWQKGQAAGSEVLTKRQIAIAIAAIVVSAITSLASLVVSIIALTK